MSSRSTGTLEGRPRGGGGAGPSAPVLSGDQARDAASGPHTLSLSLCLCPGGVSAPRGSGRPVPRPPACLRTRRPAGRPRIPALLLGSRPRPPDLRSAGLQGPGARRGPGIRHVGEAGTSRHPGTEPGRAGARREDARSGASTPGQTLPSDRQSVSRGCHQVRSAGRWAPACPLRPPPRPPRPSCPLLTDHPAGTKILGNWTVALKESKNTQRHPKT